jgi:hypothetical protein
MGLEQIVAELRRLGYDVADGFGGISSDGKTLLTINGRQMSSRDADRLVRGESIDEVLKLANVSGREERKVEVSVVRDKSEGTLRTVGRWTAGERGERVILARIFESEDRLFRIEFDLGKVALPDGTEIPVRLMWDGSDRTLEMAKQGAEAIVQNRFGVFSKVVWLPEFREK